MLRDRVFAIGAASDGRLGGMRALAALRLILIGLRRAGDPEPDRVVVAAEAYDDMDQLKHPPTCEALKALVRQLIEFPNA